MLRAFAIIVFCLALLTGLDQALDDGQYTETALEMLRQIARSFSL